MAKSRKPVDDTVPTGAGGVLFINYDLSDNDKKLFREWKQQHTDDLADMIDDVCEHGYQVSLKYDAFNKCQGAFLIAKATGTQNDGFILCGRSSTTVGALYGVFYRHYRLFEGVWPVNNHRANLLDDTD